MKKKMVSPDREGTAAYAWCRDRAKDELRDRGYGVSSDDGGTIRVYVSSGPNGLQLVARGPDDKVIFDLEYSWAWLRREVRPK